MILGIVELLATPLNQLQEGLDLSKYVQQMKGLTLAQAEAKLATEDLTDAQRRQILTSLGLVSSNDEFIISSKILTAEKLKEALASGVVSEADLEQAVSLGILTKSKDGDYIATKKLTVAELERQLVAAGMDPIIAKNIASLYADTGAKKADAGATGLLTKATIALNAAFAAHPYAMILGIIGAIAGITAAIIAYKNSVNGMIKSNQKLIESNKEAYNSLVDESKEYSNKADSLKSTYDDYLTATKGSEEYYEAVNKIAELSPDLVVGYDNEGNAIIANNEKIKEQIEYYKELAKAKQEAARQEAIENIGEETDSYQDLTGKKESIEEKYKKQKELIDEYEAIIQKESEVGYDNLSTAEQRLYTNAVNMLSVEKDKLDEYKSDLEDLSNQIKAATDQLRTDYTSLLPIEEELTDAQKAIREGLINTAIKDGMSSADFEEAYSNLNSEAVKRAGEEIINLDENLSDEEYRKQALAIYEKLANAFELTDEQKQAFKVAFKIDDDTIQNAEEVRNNVINLTKEAVGDKVNIVSEELKEAQENLQNEYQKIKDWGLEDYSEEIKNRTIQSMFGNVDMDKRTIIEWSDELKKTYQEELASWDYDPEINSIDTVFGGSARFGEELNGTGWEVAFTPILPDGTFLSKDAVYDYINDILTEAYEDDGKVTEEELKEIDAQGRQVGNTFIQGIFAAIDESENYDNNGNWAEVVGRLMHFSGEYGAVNIAQQAIEKAKQLNEHFDWGSWFDEQGIDSDEEYDQWLEIARGVDTANEAIEKWIELKEEANSVDVEETWDYSKTLEQLDTMKEKFDTLDQTYAKLFDNDENIGFEDLKSINDAFSDVSGIEDYVKSLQEAGQDSEKVQDIMNNLATAYIEQTGILENVTQENRNLIQSTLEEMGVQNAEELVVSALNGGLDQLAIEKQFVAATGIDLANATYAELSAFAEEMNYSEEARQSLYLLALEKITCNGTVLDFSGDISNIAQLVASCKSGITAIGLLNKAKSDGKYHGAAQIAQLETAAAAEVQGLLNQAKGISVSYTPKANYTGGSGTKAAKKNGGSGGGGGSGSGSEDTYEEQMDFFEKRVKKLDNAVELLKTNLDNVWGSAAKIKLINAEYDLLEEKTKNTTDALAMYEAKAAEALGKIPADLRDRVVNGAVNITDFIGKGNEETVKAIENYQNWADKVDDVKASLAELKKTMRELELEKFNAVVEEFSEKTDIRDTGIDNISKQIALLEEAGAVVGKSLYEEQKEQANKKLQELQQEKEALVAQLNDSISSGNLEVGSDEWLDAAKQLQKLDGNIIDCKKSIEEYDNAIQELDWKNLERIEKKFSDIATEIDNINKLLDDQDVALEDGTWTNEGITQLGLVAQQYELAAYEVEMYQKKIDALNKDYVNGKYSTDEYIEKLGDLKNAQWDSVNDMEDAKDAIVDIYRERVEIMTEAIEKEIEAHQEATDAKIKELEAEKDLADYREQLLDKQKSITDLERQIAAMSGDTTAATVAKRKKLEEQLSEARKDLDNFNRDHSIETQKEALTQAQEDFEEQKNAEIEALEETLEEEEALILEAFELVRGNSETISKEIEEIARKYGIKISTDVTEPWKNGESAIASYGEVLSAQSSGFIAILEGVEDEIYTMQKKADEANKSISDIFGDKSDQLVNDLNEAYSSTENLRNLAQSLKDSYVQAFDGSGYNFDSLIKKINDVTNAANAAKKAVNDAGGIEPPENPDNSQKKKINYYYPILKYENGLTHAMTSLRFKTQNEVKDWYLMNGSKPEYQTYMGKKKKSGYSIGTAYYAKGVKNLKKDELAWTQDPNGTSKTREMIISPSSGAVLTPLKKGDSVLKNKFTENVFDMAEDPEGFILSKLKNSMFNFDATPNTSAINQSNYQPVTITMGDLIKINTMQNGDPEEMKKIANAAVDKLVNDINRQTRHSGGYR